jgi:SAM-dependent methyltransferase
MGSDIWAVGEAYEAYIGRWSRAVAAEFVNWLALPRGARWLDVGCGTGALTRTVLELADPAHVTAIDPSSGFVEHARATAGGAPATFVEGDAQSLPFDDGSFDVAVSGLVINFVPDPQRALSEMTRTTRAGGTIALYVWDYAGGMELIRGFWDAAVALDPAAAALDEGRRFPICTRPALAGLFETAGLGAVEARAIDVPAVFQDFDDYREPFLSGEGPAPGYCALLGEDQRVALRESLRRTLPTGPDGTIALTVRAWAARGVRAS